MLGNIVDRKNSRRRKSVRIFPTIISQTKTRSYISNNVRIFSTLSEYFLSEYFQPPCTVYDPSEASTTLNSSNMPTAPPDAQSTPQRQQRPSVIVAAAPRSINEQDPSSNPAQERVWQFDPGTAKISQPQASQNVTLSLMFLSRDLFSPKFRF